MGLFVICFTFQMLKRGVYFRIARNHVSIIRIWGDDWDSRLLCRFKPRWYEARIAAAGAHV